MKLLFKSFYKILLHKSFCHNVNKLPDKFFITTPIYYLNAAPHIGHLYSSLLADVLKRWYDIHGVPTHFSTGTDEHGLKVLQAATDKGKHVQDYCDGLSGQFKSLFDSASISYTSFIRTTDNHHIMTVQRVWRELEKRGWIEKGSYSGWYSISDEAYVPQDQVEERVGLDGEKFMACTQTGNRLEWFEEDTFVFPLKVFSERLLQWLDSGVIHPSHHLEPIRQWIQSGLPPLSLSRQKNKNPWGIPVPGNHKQNVYVWLDALVNYLTVSNYNSPHPSSPSLSSSLLNWWPANCQVVGKDIIKFHAVYWPAFLMALDLPLPAKVLCHGHWMVEKEKMSKSKGNVIDPSERIQRWSPDALRYYLMKESSISSDCDYSDQRAIECINADLVNTLGNLLSRATGRNINPSQTFPLLDAPTYHHLINTYTQGNDILSQLYKLSDIVDHHYRNLSNNKAIESVISHLYVANAFFQHCTPWKKERTEVDCVIHVSCEVVRVCCIALQPVIPHLANKALDRLNIPSNQRSFQHMSQPIHLLRKKNHELGSDNGVLLQRIKKEDWKKEKN